MENTVQSKDKITRLIIYVLLILISLSILVPIIWVLFASFKQNHEFFGSPWTLPETFTFKNFRDAIVDANMDFYIVNSFIVTGLAILINLIIALPASYSLSRLEYKGKHFLRNLFMAGLFINMSYIVVPLFIIAVDIDKFLMSSVFIDNHLVVALIYATTSLPFTIYLLTGHFEVISDSYEEAAKIDGANEFQIMTKVYFPLAKPAIITATLFNFLGYWNEYILAMTFLPTNEKRTLQVGLLNLMHSDTAKANYGRLYAGMMLAIVPALFLYVIFQRKIFAGMDTGGVKE